MIAPSVTLTAALFFALCVSPVVAQAQSSSATPVLNADGSTQMRRLDCGFTKDFHKEFLDAVARGEIPDPSTKRIPEVAPRIECGATTVGPLGHDDIYLYEDAESLLRTNYSDGQLLALLIDAVNTLLAEHGDQWDLIGFFLSFTPARQLGGGFYFRIENDVEGIGSPVYDYRPTYGVAGNNVEGCITMWNIDNWWVDDDWTRIVLAQEFEHRWAMFLSPITGNRILQGDNGACGRMYHWNFAVDGQGSNMEIAEWVGSNPAIRTGGNWQFNKDNGGLFSFTDLYLMGYVSAAEMDSGNSELRFMDNTPDCNSPYSGPIFDFTSADIIAADGPRVPDWTTSQQDWKTGWIMVHLPGEPPTTAQLDRAVGVLEQHQSDWNDYTLGRGTMDNSIAFGNFSTTPNSGQSPLPVNFGYESQFVTNGWKWYFGDGDSAMVENPSHVYGPGVHDVELYAMTNYGERYTIKRDHIYVWADTASATDLSVPVDTGAFYWEINLTNAVPIEELVLPISLTGVPSTVSLDSISIQGCRTGAFESLTIPYDNRFTGQMAIALTADVGGGTSPLAPGTGPVARVYMTTKPSAAAGDSVVVSFDPLGSFALKAVTIPAEFTPASTNATLTIMPPSCVCPCQGDLDCDSFIDSIDLAALIDIVFFGVTDTQDPSCPTTRADFNADAFADAADLAEVIDHVYFGGSGPVEPCGL